MVRADGRDRSVLQVLQNFDTRERYEQYLAKQESSTKANPNLKDKPSQTELTSAQDSCKLKLVDVTVNITIKS